MNNEFQKVVILGNGLLGSEMHRQTGWDVISRSQDGFDISRSQNFKDYFIDENSKRKKYDTIINCVANTDTYNKEKDTHWRVNYTSVMDLVDFTNEHEIKLVHISSDYVYTNSVPNASEKDVPVHGRNWYSYTKLLADAYIEARSNNYLICRCTHKKNPFPYEKAWINQIGNFDYVDVIASLIIQAIKRDCVGVYNVGTKLKTMYDLAIRTKEVEPCFFEGDVPKNVSMNTDKLNNRLHEN